MILFFSMMSKCNYLITVMNETMILLNGTIRFGNELTEFQRVNMRAAHKSANVIFDGWLLWRVKIMIQCTTLPTQVGVFIWIFQTEGRSSDSIPKSELNTQLLSLGSLRAWFTQSMQKWVQTWWHTHMNVHGDQLIGCTQDCSWLTGKTVCTQTNKILRGLWSSRWIL